MRSRIQKLLSDLTDAFWLVPGSMVLAGVLAGIGFVELDRSGIIPQRLLDSPWLYNGGVTGARTLLGAVASSTIGVAGTVFSITIAALSLAAGQMGPRLLRNFTRDRGNQITLGIFLGTFSYALMVLAQRARPERGRVHTASVAQRSHRACVRVRGDPRLFRRPHGKPHQCGHGGRVRQRGPEFGHQAADDR